MNYKGVQKEKSKLPGNEITRMVKKKKERERIASRNRIQKKREEINT